MPDRRANTANAYESTLTNAVSGTDLAFNVQSTSGAPGSPCYLCIDPENPAKREYVWFDDAFTGTAFITTALSNRHLAGSAASSGLTHDAGAVVRAVTAAQLITDLHDRVDAMAGGYRPGGTDVAVADGGTGASDTTTARSNLGIPALLALKANLASPMFTGEVRGNDFRPNTSTIAGIGTVSISLSGPGLLLQPLTGNVTYAVTDLDAGRSVTIRVKCDATSRNLTFPADWAFVSAKPPLISASKTGILTLTSFGSTNADVVAAWAVQQ